MPAPDHDDVLSPALGRGWRFPLARDPKSGSALEAAHDEEVVSQSIWLILSTAKGERVMRPDFGCGLRRLIYQPNNGATRALAAFE
jgi:phage baseplate assembly protein W